MGHLPTEIRVFKRTLRVHVYVFVGVVGMIFIVLSYNEGKLMLFVKGMATQMRLVCVANE